MNTFPIIVTFVGVFTFSGCTQKNSSSKEMNNTINSISKIEIHLLPAFENDCVISIDNESRTVEFFVDTSFTFIGESNPSRFSSNLDSFRTNTLIDSFYSPSFLESIRSKGDLAFDGLTIITIIDKDNKPDTIDSGNIYPQILAANIVSQISYVSIVTRDTALKKYIARIKRYFD